MEKNKESKVQVQQVSQDEQELPKLQTELVKLVKDAAGTEIGMHLIESTVTRILEVVPLIRKKKAVLRFERAFDKYRVQLQESGIEEALIKNIVEARRSELADRLYQLEKRQRQAVEKKIGISDTDKDSTDFDNLRLLLGKTNRMDEIEVIVTRIKQRWDEQYGLEDLHVGKRAMAARFVEEAGFDDDLRVMDTLLNSTPQEVMAKTIVSEQRLAGVLKGVKEEYVKLSKYIVSAMNNKVKIVNNVIKKQIDIINKSMLEEAPVAVQLLSRLLIVPLSLFLSLTGMSIAALYITGMYLTEMLERILPEFAVFMDSAGIVRLAESLEPLPVMAAAFLIFIIGGTLRLLDDKIKRAAINKRIADKKGSYIY
jgi:hypothetical protein